MSTDRDLAVAILRAVRSSGVPLTTGWEMTAATGVRGLRIAAEAGPFEAFLLTEAQPAALAVLRRNGAGRGGVQVLEHDARVPAPGGPFEYVDLDPYGSPAPFVPAAIGSLRAGGLLAVTATDMMVLAGAQPAACRRRYGAEPVRGRLGPEGGLRILLGYVAAAGRRAGLALRPVASYVRGHHVRAYLRAAPAAAGDDPVGMIDPSEWDGPTVGGNGPYGPLWLGPLFDAGVVERLVPPETAEHPTEVAVLVARFREECVVDRPFYFEANELARSLHLARPPALSELRRAIEAIGFRTARTHARPSGFRTDAPRAAVEARALEVARGQSQNARVRA